LATGEVDVFLQLKEDEPHTLGLVRASLVLDKCVPSNHHHVHHCPSAFPCLNFRENSDFVFLPMTHQLGQPNMEGLIPIVMAVVWMTLLRLVSCSYPVKIETGFSANTLL